MAPFETTALHHEDWANFWLSSTTLSFAAGALSASLVWYASLSSPSCVPVRRFPRAGPRKQEEKAKLSSWNLSVEELRSRIGELPSLKTRTRWPWDRRRSQSPLASKEEAIRTHSSAIPSTPDTRSSPSAQKSGTCIGSIFGLDVGGTLAKLVYFEQETDAPVEGHRERQYRNAASAQTVLNARNKVDDSGIDLCESKRRIGSPTRHHGANGSTRAPPLGTLPAGSNSLSSSDSNADLEKLSCLRQESMPDDLFLYARAVQQPNDSLHDEHLRKSRSMLNLSGSSKDRAEAMERFYDFARRLDSYRAGAKDHKLSFYSRELGGEFHFIQFETRRMQNAMDLIRANDLHNHIVEMGATGGGAHKFASAWQEELGITMHKEEELESLVAGMQFVLSTVIGECYTYRPEELSRASSRTPSTSESSAGATATIGNSKVSIGKPLSEDENDERIRREDKAKSKGDGWRWSRKVQRDAITYSSTYPYMLVTIGTGVSILRVDGPRKHERVSGSTIGGGTYWGLIRLLTDIDDFEHVMRLAEQGDATKVDMMVGDIYGNKSDALEKLGLPSNLVASSFGKLVAKDDPANGLKEEDLARALLLMVTNNIGQVAYLNAKLHNTPRIYFVGNFLRQNNISQRRLAYAIDFWSKGEMEALFLEHEGYFGALGAFLLSQGISESKQRAWKSSQSVSSIGEASVENEGSARPSLNRRHTIFPTDFRNALSSVFS
jgi:type II pantothenate kinase